MYIATPFQDSLDELAESTFKASNFEIANLGYAIASILDNEAPDFKLKIKGQQNLAKKIALSLKTAKNPLIISGISSGDKDIVQAALNIATALLSVGSKVMLSIVLPECNSMGLALIPGKPLDEAILLAKNDRIDTLVVLENDLYRRADEASVNNLFEKSNQIIVIDHLLNKTTLCADILLPATTFAESEGTLVNNEGRAQRFYKAIPGKNHVKESWKWIGEVIKIKNNNQTVLWDTFDDVVSSMINELPVFSKLQKYMRGADFRMFNAKIPRQTMRYSGRTAINANIAVNETGISQDHDSPLAFSMEGLAESPPSSFVPFYWTPGWNSVQSLYNYVDKPNGSMKGGNPGIRLIEPPEGEKNSYFNIDNQDTGLQKGEWLILPVYQIFGSEELSSAGSTLTQRIQEPFVRMNRKDAEILNIEDSDVIILEISKSKLRLKVKIDNSLRQGIAGLSVNLPDMPFIDLPGRGKFVRL